MAMASYVAVEPGDDTPPIIPAGKFQGALFADLDWDEVVALRRDQHVPRIAVGSRDPPPPSVEAASAGSAPG